MHANSSASKILLFFEQEDQKPDPAYFRRWEVTNLQGWEIAIFHYVPHTTQRDLINQKKK